ncbi:MAG TPA: pyridoxal phosphate-dependent aminotransferase family protein [Syntrophales bacterium]|nr:pyridoxal phosphate-dependent aminotransferase family protein [Syntrophales bacterium]
MFTEKFRNRLIAQRQAGLYRDPPEVKKRDGKYLFINGKRVLNFASNDYLGLGVSDEVRRSASRNFRRYGTSSSSSRLVSGNYSIISEAEKVYASYFGYADALFFPSGYQANLGILSTLFEHGDTIIFDKHIHASSVKGMMMSGANVMGYNHNSMTHLARRLEKCGSGHVVVLTESLFSMDGDILHVSGIKELKERYGFLTIVDEAHAFGALGSGGRGVARSMADAAVGTFGKAFGFFGAFVLLPEGLKEYLFNFSSPLIYTTTLPEAHAATTIDILRFVEEADDRRARLREASTCIREGLRAEGFHVTGDAHILALEVGNENKAVSLSRKLLQRNIFVLLARYPTVPLHRSILRISVTAFHDEEDVKSFIRHVKEANEEIGKEN